MMEMSKEYGTALYMVAKENKSERELLEALSQIVNIFEQNPEYIDLLSTPSISKEERVGIIEEAFGKQMPEHVVSFLKLLCERGRIRQLYECVEEYNRLFDEDMKMSVARVVSCVELTKIERDRLKKRLEKITGRKITLDCEVDKSVLGGLVVYVDGKVIDGTLRHRLDEMKDVMSR